MTLTPRQAEVIAQAQRLRGFMEGMPARDHAEAEAMIDFIDAVDDYNLNEANPDD